MNLTPDELKLAYFVVDTDDQFWRVDSEPAEEVWREGKPASEITGDLTDLDGDDIEVGDELRLATVLSDDKMNPLVTFLLRVPLDDDRVTDAGRDRIFDALNDDNGADPTLNEHARFQLAVWPGDWRSRLAVAMDSPASSFDRVGLGGPMVMADHLDLPMPTVMGFFADALEEFDNEDADDE